MIVYSVYIQDKFGYKETLLTTTDKNLAKKTVNVLNTSLLKILDRAILSFNTKEEQEPYTWWYDESFSQSFLEKLWKTLNIKKEI